MSTDIPASTRAPCPPPPFESEPRACPQGMIPAARLFQDSREVLISHNGQAYRLRITKNGKLILTK
jgi:hemin uptake protein HemP